ncbi:uncharacterized protein [Porites lutea]|uniref:uncharacterized protein n=1 Tax=Porites lutea TaxID=51062 RepID=UPI003CC61C24
MSVLNSVVILSLFSVSLFVNSNASVWPLPTSIYLSGPPLPISPVFTFKTSSTSGVLKRGITRYLEIILQQIVGGNVDNHLRANQTLSELVLSVRSDNESLQVDTSYWYILKVSNGKASIEAKTPYGALYAIETFSQLIVDGNLINSTVNIDDQPQYVHRGLMLDTGCRYFPFELVKNILDGMSFVKLNVLHLHILDWCRFSVQSKLYPELQERTTQFYTQEQIKDLVSYAGDRGIRVIPEVESASHVAGMIGLINKTKGLRFCNVSGFLELYNDPQGVTLTTMKNILEEMMTLFPEQFFHLGLDEVTTSTLCSLQNTRSLEQELMKFLVQKGKIPYAWQEALISTSAAIKGTVLQAWKGSVVKTLIDGGFQVINSLSSNFYLSSLVDFSALWTNISAGLNPDEMTLVLGGEMAMWTDDYCFVDQCFLYKRGKPDAWWMFGPESDSQFTESVSGIIWPSAIVGAGSFWNYQSKLTPDSKEFAVMIDTQHKRMVQRGILTCPSGCKCDVLTRCGQKYPQPY